jgi:putative nucleotidyltransferase with HDIG domain
MTENGSRGLLAPRFAAFMTSLPHTETIEVSALRVGMTIHLDRAWMSHPFAQASFRISSTDQVDTLRSMGLTHVLWSPQDDAPYAAPPQPSSSSPPANARQRVPSADDLRRESLADQRRALAVCERQFTEIAQGSRQIFDSVASQPQQAREAAEGLTRRVVEQMVGSEDLCIRLLSEGAGDRAGAHAVNVSVISLLMGRTFGLGEAEMLDLGLGALLHDIGKAELPERFRHREDHFSAAEHKMYESHVAHGTTQAKRMGLSPGASLVIAQHHEHVDGSGFPLKLQSDRTTVLSRIVALVNRYDNLCNPANPGKALTPHEAVALMFAQGRNKYDASILAAFIKMMGVYPVGSVVQLTDDRYALVVGAHPLRPLKPIVMVHDPEVRSDDSLPIDIGSIAGLGIRRSLKPFALPPPVLQYLAPRARMNYFFEPRQDVELVMEAAA